MFEDKALLEALITRLDHYVDDNDVNDYKTLLS